MAERCEAVPGGMMRCTEIATGHFTKKAASGQLRAFPLCGKHIEAWQQAACVQNEERAREQRQREYVKRWREDHPGLVMTSEWRCPLCNELVQTVWPENVSQSVCDHQNRHGADWQGYLAAGQPAASGAPERGGGRVSVRMYFEAVAVFSGPDDKDVEARHWKTIVDVLHALGCVDVILREVDRDGAPRPQGAEDDG